MTTFTDHDAARLLPLAGGFNFRDLGGYRTLDGRCVRWRRLYRSGKLSALTAGDVARLAGEHIRLVCDLRTPQERAQEPSVTGFGAVHRGWDQDAGHSRLRDAVASEGATPRDVQAALAATYREMPWQFARPYADVFRLLAEGELPLVFHCAGGKDRTGVLAALLLLALGVQEEVVVADYLLTDRFLDVAALQRASAARGDEAGAAGFSSLAGLSPELRAPLLRCDAAYLRAALDAVAQRHGSVPTYLDEALGIDAAALGQLREGLLG